MDRYSTCTRIALMIQFGFLEIPDLIFDWDFYYEVRQTEHFKDKAISWFILVFASYGTILFLVDLIYLWKAVCAGTPSKKEDLVSCLTTWTEDFPQMIMAVYVAGVIGKPIEKTRVQYFKAILAIVESAIRCIIIIVNCCCCEDDDPCYKGDNQRSCPRLADTLNFIGYVVIFILAIIILGIIVG